MKEAFKRILSKNKIFMRKKYIILLLIFYKDSLRYVHNTNYYNENKT